jgi:hypothetical protein
MLSIIVSSYKADVFLNFEASLAKTIGLTYELIKIENKNEYSLSQAYNLGAAKSKYEILCFIHEDVEFLTRDWGAIIIGLFEEIENLGVIGLSGAKVKSHLPTGWSTQLSEYDVWNLVNYRNDNYLFHTTRRGKEQFANVKVLDGMFLATKKSIWEEFRFDESLSGFHLYDLDFSLRATAKYLGIVSYEFLIIHFSTGGFNEDWIKSTLEYHKRIDKVDLFEHRVYNEPKIRRSWYRFLSRFEITKENKIRYMESMGMDCSSFIFAYGFKYPKLGRLLEKIINIIR